MVRGATQAIVTHSLQISVVLTTVGQVVTLVVDGMSLLSGGRSMVNVRETVSLSVAGGFVGRVSWMDWARMVVPL